MATSGVIRASAGGYLSNYDQDQVSDDTGLDTSVATDDPEELRGAQQQFKEEADINVLVRRFGLTGQMPGNFAMPMAGDFSEVGDFQSSMELLVRAQEEFMRIPAELRARFANDPQRLYDFLGDAGNRDEAIKLGLIPKPVERTRDVVQAVDELASRLVPKA